jgi:hypothetical protein
MVKTLIVVLLFLLFIACDEDNGNEAAVYETLSPFNALELNSVFDVYLIQDTIDAIRVTADESVINNIVFRVDNEILRINNSAELKWLQPATNKVKLFIHFRTLSKIWPNETCSITTLNPIQVREFSIIMGHHPKLAVMNLELDCETFYYWNNHQCGGKLTLRGQVQYLTVLSFGLMSVEADGLRSEYALIENNSKGDCKVHVSSQLEYSIRSVGNIYLQGSPASIIPGEISSSGRLIKVY